MTEMVFWTRDRFPVVYEGEKAKAVLVDVDSFARMELILDNLLNRDEEPEDAILAASAQLRKLLAQAQQSSPSSNWIQELNEL